MQNIDKLLVTLLILFIIISIINSIAISISLSVTGRTITVGQVGFFIMSRCSINLKPGWNLISLCANVSNTSIENVLSSIKGKYRYVMVWNESSQEFNIYSPNAANPPFDKFNLSKSYFILITTNETNLYLAGNDFEDLNISLLYGWNSPTYPYSFTTNVSKYLKTISGKYRYMMKWDASNQKFLIYSPRAFSNPFYSISMGEGQFILINHILGALLQYNKTDLKN